MGNRSIGTAAAGGMLFGTIFGLILIPGLYVLFASMGHKMKKKDHNILDVDIIVDHHQKD